MIDTQKLSKAITGIFICALLFSCNNSNVADKESEKKTVTAPIDETVLNLCVNVVEEPEADEGVQNGYAWILTGNPAGRLETLEVKILKEHLNGLRQQADAAHDQQGCPGFVTGLQLHVGLDGRNLQVL